MAALREFIAVLKQEQQVLVAGDIDRLMPLVDQKSSIAARLGRFAEIRNKALTAAGLTSDRAGIEAWLKGRQMNTTVRGNWKKLLALTAEAQPLNETNGKLIAMRLQHNQQALNVLLAASNQAILYGPDGQTKTSGRGHLFGKA